MRKSIHDLLFQLHCFGWNSYSEPNLLDSLFWVFRLDLPVQQDDGRAGRTFPVYRGQFERDRHSIVREERTRNTRCSDSFSAPHQS